jgi:lysophospholipase L1-like esterase
VVGSKGREWLARAALALGSLLCSLCVLEAGFRAKAYLDDRELDAFERLEGARVVHDPNAPLRTADIIRLSSNPAIIYELIPGLEASYRGAQIRVNALGFRGPELAREKPPGTVRIAGLGDSVMFGWGVAEDELYLARLAAALRERAPEVRWEWINSAVPGYSTPIEVEVFADRLLAYRPDLVIVGFIPNDVELPNFVRSRSPYLRPDRSYLRRYLRALRKGMSRAPDDRLAAAPRDEDEVPPEYRELRGMSSVVRAIDRLGRLASQHRFRALVLAYPACPAALRAACGAHGFACLEAGPAFERWLGERGLERSASPLVLAPDDPHPSAQGHQLIADLLLQRLEESGELELLRSRALGAHATR